MRILSSKKKNKNWIIVPLSAGLVFSLITPGAVSFAEEIMDHFQVAVFGGPSQEHILHVPAQESLSLKDQIDNSHLESFDGVASKEQNVFESVEIQPEVNPTIAKSLTVDVQSKDMFQLSQEQMEALLAKGYSIEDLYRLDELANKFLLDPETIAVRKENDGLSWGELDTELTLELEQKHLDTLSTTYPEAYAELKKEDLTDHERLVLLIAFDMRQGTITDLLKIYKTSGEQGLVTATSSTKTQSLNRSNAAETMEIDAEVRQRIKEIAKETGITESDLLKQFLAAKEASKQALAEKE